MPLCLDFLINKIRILANHLRCFSHFLRVLSTFFRATHDFFCRYLLGKIKDALPRCEAVLREASLAFLNKRLRAARVDKARVCLCDAP